MIAVEPQPEPPTFGALVRNPGRAYLRSCKRTTRKDFKRHAYWRSVLKDLHTSYRGICAYSCHWIPFDTGDDNVEHFRPKGKYPNLAYEWKNYRLACGTLNGRKGTSTDVLDPFKVKNGWFVLKFPSMLITAAPELSPAASVKVWNTIRRLRLNDDDTCVQARHRYLQDFAAGDISWAYLQRNAPFIAAELERQGLVHSVATFIA